MREQSYKVQKTQGLHARPAAEILKIVKAHKCRLFVKVKGVWKESGIMQLLLLGASPGAQVHFKVEGGHEDACLDAISKLLEKEE